jgi:hypothetical protein
MVSAPDGSGLCRLAGEHGYYEGILWDARAKYVPAIQSETVDGKDRIKAIRALDAENTEPQLIQMKARADFTRW